MDGFQRIVQDIPVRRFDLTQIIAPVLQAFVNIGIAELVSSVLPDRGVASIVEQEGRTIDALAGLRVYLMNEDLRGFAVGDFQESSLPVFHFNAVGRGIQQITACGFGFRYGVPAAFQSGQRNVAGFVGGVAADHFAVHFTDFKGHAGNARAGFLVALGNEHTANRRIEESQRLRIVSIDSDGLRRAVENIARDGRGFLYHIGIGGELREDNHTGFIRVIQPIGGNCALRIRHKAAGRVGNGKGDALQRLTGHSVFFDDNQTALRLVSELQRYGFIRLDFDALGRIVEDIAGNGARFLYHNGDPRLQVVNLNRAAAVGHKQSVAVAQHKAVGGNGAKLHISKRRSGHCVLFDDQ